MSDDEGEQLYQAAKGYTECGIIVHPLYRTDEKNPRCKSPGKQPMLKKWSVLSTPLDDNKLKHYFLERKCNIGAVCGKVSDITVLDVDWIVKGIWSDLFDGIDTAGWVSQRRIQEKLHIFFRYTDKIDHAIKQDLGFDLLNDRSNIVLAPSVHVEGQKYVLGADITSRPQMPGVLAERINATIQLYDRFSKTLSLCRHVFRGLWAAVFTNKRHPLYHKTTVFHSAEGRARTLAFFAELKAAGAPDEELRLACQLIFGEQYDEQQSLYQISQIKPEATAKTATIKKDPILSEFFDPLTAKHEAKTLNRARKAATVATENVVDVSIDKVDEDEIAVPQEEKDAAMETALNVLQSGDPIQYVLDTVAKYHTGDLATEEGICISIAGQSCLNTAGIQISVNGESGSGKSHALKMHLHLVPRKYKRITSLSAKAAYYMGLEAGTIIFSDDTCPSEDMEEVIKRATTNYQEWTFHTTVKDQKVANFKIPPRINWYLTSVDSDVSDQLLNRQLTFNTIETIAQKEAIYNMQKQEALSGELGILVICTEVLVCRRIYDVIRSRLFKVKIPFANDIEMSDKQNSRTFPLFLDMVKGYTIFFHAQRDTDGEGYLLATVDDFRRAKKLFESQTDGIVTKLNDKERRIIEYIGTHPHCNIPAIAAGTKIQYGTVANLLKGRRDRTTSGLLDKYKGLEISEETHTTEDEGSGKISKRGTYFRITGKYDYWKTFNTGFIYLRGDRN